MAMPVYSKGHLRCDIPCIQFWMSTQEKSNLKLPNSRTIKQEPVVEIPACRSFRRTGFPCRGEERGRGVSLFRKEAFYIVLHGLLLMPWLFQAAGKSIGVGKCKGA